ncbi:MAG: ComEC/Rec2 family competence protein [Bacilli bacterium]|nr:ComEC/Rec2 family competence protein [Bacilli bacterium]
MKLLFLFLSIFLGFSLFSSPIGFGITFVILIICSIKRFKAKFTILCLLLFTVFTLLSLIKLNVIRDCYQGVVIEAKENYAILLCRFERIYLPIKENNIEIGDIINVTGTKSDLNFITIQSQFDFSHYLNNKGIFNQLNVDTINTIFKNPIRLKQIRMDFLNHFDENTKSLIGSILFSEGETGEATELMSQLHLSRLATVSGVYIYAFLKMLNGLYSRKFSEKNSKILALITLSPYLIFTFNKLSIKRIVFLYIFRLINEYKFNKKIDNLSIISIIAIIFLLLDPYLSRQDSFILGFFIPIVSHFINQAFRKKKKTKKYILSSLLIYVFYIPFEIKFFNEISPLSIVFQTIYSPIFILLALFSLLCFIKIPLYPVVNTLAKGCTNLLGWCNKINPKLFIPPFPDWLTLIYYLLFALCLVLITIKLLPISRFIFVISICLSIIYVLPIQNFVTAEVDFINVGQGDSCLIRYKTTTILIDTGGSLYLDVAKDSLIPYLKSKRIYNIDCVITTHDDNDHKGALESLCSNFNVKEYINDIGNFPLSFNNLTLINYNNFVSEWKEENDTSLVIGFALCDTNFLIMGDAPKKIENLIMKEFDYIPCDVLKIGHHGSNTSTSDKFIKYLKPQDAVISVGKNKYGHPDSSVIGILKNNNVTIKRTDKIGTIIYSYYCF